MRVRRRSRRLLATTAGVLLVGAATVFVPVAARGSSALAGAQDSSSAASPLPPRAAIVSDAVSQLESLAESTFPSVFGGISVDNPERTAVTVHLSGVSSRVEDVLRSATPLQVSFVSVAHPLSVLDKDQAALEANWETLQNSGIPVVGFWSDIHDGLEHVRVQGLTADNHDQFASAIEKLVPAADFVLEDGLPAIATARTGDTSPYTAGDFTYYWIDSDQQAGCTSGWSYEKNNATYFLSAAHCFRLDTSVQNGQCNADCSPTQITGSGRVLGTVDYRNTVDHNAGDPANDAMDIELVRAPTSATVWRGAPGDSHIDAVDGIIAPHDGDIVCNGGAYSGAVCKGEIENTNQCVTISVHSGTRNVCHMNYATTNGSGDSVLNETGDSGGPVWQSDSTGKIYAEGIVSAATQPTTCVYNTNQRCFSDLYFVGIPAINSYYDGYVIGS